MTAAERYRVVQTGEIGQFSFFVERNNGEEFVSFGQRFATRVAAEKYMSIKIREEMRS